MRTTQILITLTCICFCITGLSSQKAFKKAEKQFSLKAYDLAVSNYMSALEEDPECVFCTYMVAESYRMMNKNLDAALWFRKLSGKADLPEDYHLKYGLVMKRMGQYDKAQEEFFKYKLMNPAEGEHYALSCDYAKSALMANDSYEISLYRSCSKASDFGTTFFDDKIIFSSFRSDMERKNDLVVKSYVQNRGSQLFVCNKGVAASKDNLDFYRSDLQEDYEIAAASISGDQELCAYTKTNFVNGFRQIRADEMDLSLYFSSLDANGKLTEEQAFKYNELGYATAFPSLNHNGTILYFASNRPGGLGGFDLYVSYFKDGDWTYPENLGSKINTPGNEVTPFYDGELLTFSSDYHHGLGGFDVFKSNVQGGDWSYPVNYGKGVNSPEDDLYFAVDPQTKTYYVSSNRLGGRGNHDIYYAVPIYEHDLAVNTSAIENSTMVPKAVSLIDLESGMEANEPGRVLTVNQKEEINIPVEHKPTVTKISGSKPSAVSIAENGKSSPAKKVNEQHQVILDQNPPQQSTDEEFDPQSPPPAVNLNNLELKINNNKAPSTKEVSNTETVTTNVSSSAAASSAVSLSGAKKVAMGEVIFSNSNVYFIQLAALFSNQANINSFNNLTGYGSLYKMYESSATKIKLGYYLDEYEAKQILSKVKNAGYGDAFITYGPLNTNNMELALSTDSGSSTYTTSTSSTQYKIRLASYEDAQMFDVNRVKDIGVIEQWSKQNWTIFVLSGFNSLEEAENAKVKSINRGFADAEVVVDNNGILEKLVRN